MRQTSDVLASFSSCSLCMVELHYNFAMFMVTDWKGPIVQCSTDSKSLKEPVHVHLCCLSVTFKLLHRVRDWP